MRMLVLLFEFTEPASDAESSPLAENIPLPFISFILYPEHGLLKIADYRICLTLMLDTQNEHMKIN